MNNAYSLWLAREYLARRALLVNGDTVHLVSVEKSLLAAGEAGVGGRAREATWRRDPGLYYEDGYQELADRGGKVAAVSIGAVDWVKVDNHSDLRRAREIAGHC